MSRAGLPQAVESHEMERWFSLLRPCGYTRARDGERRGGAGGAVGCWDINALTHRLERPGYDVQLLYEVE